MIDPSINFAGLEFECPWDMVPVCVSVLAFGLGVTAVKLSSEAVPTLYISRIGERGLLEGADKKVMKSASRRPIR